ncbi:MAG: hypothetical protein R3D55_21265 [Chloroflexota bacterium]
MLENTNAKNTGKRLINWKSVLGLGLALFIVGGLVMLVQPAAAQTADGSLPMKMLPHCCTCVRKKSWPMTCT